MIFWIILWLAAVALVIVFAYFFNQRRQTDEVWRRFRQGQKERQHAPREQPIDPTFQFGQPPVDSEKDKPDKAGI
jgi:hypothetical protein